VEGNQESRSSPPRDVDDVLPVEKFHSSRELPQAYMHGLYKTALGTYIRTLQLILHHSGKKSDPRSHSTSTRELSP
jgi:hypothetical protein